MFQRVEQKIQYKGGVQRFLTPRQRYGTGTIAAIDRVYGSTVVEKIQYRERDTTRRDCPVTVGLISPNDLDLLATGLRRIYPPADCACFNDLLTAIDEADARPWSAAAGLRH